MPLILKKLKLIGRQQAVRITCAKGGGTTPACILVKEFSGCTIGLVEQVRCTTCSEIIDTEIHT